MCGIVAILATHGHRVPAPLVNDMLDTIVHRGPDDRGSFVSSDGAVALGSQRLSIIDLSRAGKMPMANETNSIRVTFNGEIYNYQKIRGRLKANGHIFRSSTDTEVIVHLYEEMGPGFVSELEGMFSFALWDATRDQLLIARDRLGEKPLYYAKSGFLILISSEIKALLTAQTVARKANLQALSQYLTFGFVMPPDTMFHGIRKVEPGELLVFDSTGLKFSERYWSPAPTVESFFDAREIDFKTHVRNVTDLLDKSVADRLVADVPVGAFLSGGIDSSTVVALMARHMNEKPEAVTISYPEDLECDETRYARQAADAVGANLHEVHVTESDARAVFSDCIRHLDEPIADPAFINTFFGSEFLRSSGIPVALVGEGADELLLGYPYYRRHSRLATLWTLRRWVPKLVQDATYRACRPLLGPLGLSAHRDLLRRAFSDEGLFLSSEPFFSDLEKRAVGGPSLLAIIDEAPAFRETERILAETHGVYDGDVIAQMGYAETRMRMAEKLLMRVDKMSMAHSVEIRAPFLCHRLAEYLLALPSSIRQAQGQPKQILKSAAANLLPSSIINRPKVGFSTPVTKWFRSSFGTLLENRVNTSGLVQKGYLSAAEISRLLQLHRSGASWTHTRLWNLLCLLEWEHCFEVKDVIAG